MTEEPPEQFPIVWEAIALAVIGVAVFWAGRLWGDGAAKPMLEILGASGLLIAPLIWRAEGSVSIGLKGLSLNLARRDRHRMAAVLAAAGAPEDRLQPIVEMVAAPHRAMAGILPFLAGDVASELIDVPSAWWGRTLKDVTFLRQELNIAVVALREQGETRWQVGGRVTETKLADGMVMLACGRPEDLRALRTRIEEDRTIH